jgi:serine/threonine protein kinase
MVAPGTRLGSYEIVSLLGSGGMGEVYRGRDMRLGREVALKLLPPAFAADPDRLARFEVEARAAAALQHPNICTIYGVDQSAEGQPFLVMELLAGETLQQRLLRGPLTIRELLEFGSAIADALDHAHSKGPS